MQIHGGEGTTKDIRLDFSVNVNPLCMPKSVRDALKSLLLDPAAAETYPDRSCKKLRLAAAGHYRVPDDWIVCGCGASELIYKIAYRYRGCRALVVSPGFGEYEKALREAGCEVCTVELKREHGFAFDDDFLERFCRAVEGTGERPALVFLCSPNNPAGGRIPDAMLEKMLIFCMRRGVRAVVDECFLPFVTGEESTIEFMKESVSESGDALARGKIEISPVFRSLTRPEFGSSRTWEGEERSPALRSSTCTATKDTQTRKKAGVCPIILKALTKSHAIPGVRLGLAISADKKLIRELQDAGPPWTVSGIAAKLGEAAFDGWDEEEFDSMRKAVAGERAYLVNGLAEAGAKIYCGEGNFILFSVEEGASLFSFMQDSGILIRSCESFGLGTNFYRIAVRTRQENACFLKNFRNWAGECV